MSRRLGLIVGLNHYQDPLFSPLQFAENDAKALAQWLVNAKGGKWSPADVQMVRGTHVTKELVESLLVQVCIHMAEPGDLIFLYFAGHAFVDEQSGAGYLALSNTRYQDPSTGLHLLSFTQQVLTRTRASQVVFMLDCFQNGTAWSRLRSAPFDCKPLLGPALLNTLQQQGERLFFCSCRGNEFGAETGERGLGLFIHRMIVGLCGPAIDPQTGMGTLQQLHSYLLSALGDQQRPQIFGQSQQPILLIGEKPAPPEQPQAPQAPTARPGAPPTRPLTGQEPYNKTGGLNRSGTLTASPEAQPQRAPATGAPADPQRQRQSELLLQQAQQRVQEQRYPEAISLIEQGLQLVPDHTGILILKGQLLGTLGRTQEALLVVEQLLQREQNNALAWSMRAVLLNNAGRYSEAREAIEHSLELDPNNPESYAIKTNIMGSIASAESYSNPAPASFGTKSGALASPRKSGVLASPPRKSGALASPPTSGSEKRAQSFLLFSMLQIVAFVLGIAGVGLLILQPRLPVPIGLGLASLGLAVLAVNALRGTFRRGAVYLLPTLLLSLLAGGLLGGLFKLGYNRILLAIQQNVGLLIPILIFALWLALLALLPLLLALIGLVGGLFARRRA